ncbi:MAG TPA: carboxypeptidase regulatory-like domain-containing protein [Candidatus Angelobacter sp.]|nr:carboxypeptidase regulatory-like domain-containing protein [Candidatus Angelobacter sp.]
MLAFERRRSSFALRWGMLAAAIAICAVLLVATRHRGVTSAYKQTVPAKAPGQIAADLKTPPELAEMHALRDDRVVGKTGVTREADANKVIPTPKHMTAKPAAKFDFDQSGQVRMTPRSEAAQTANLQTEGRNSVTMDKLDASTAASAQAAPSAIGGLVQNKNAAAYTAASGQGQGVLAKIAAGNLGGTVLDPSGAVIANATVTTVGPIGTRAAQSDSQGRFSFDHLVSGTYSVKAQAPGFKTAEIGQVAVLDQPLDLKVTLNVGSTSEAVEVTAASPAVETTSAEIALNEKQANQLSRKKSVAANRPATAKTLSVAIPQWTLSPNGIVRRSLDAGKSWQNVPVAGTAGFRALSSAGTHVWVGGSAGALYHSADSGQTWTRVAPVAAGCKLESDITHVDFADPMNGTVTTASGEVWNTSDGGQSWQVR